MIVLGFFIGVLVLMVLLRLVFVGKTPLSEMSAGEYEDETVTDPSYQMFPQNLYNRDHWDEI